MTSFAQDQVTNPKPADAAFAVRALSRAEISLAFPLLRIVNPDITLNQWRAFAETIVHARRFDTMGVKVAVDPRACSCGLFTWRRERSLAEGAVLAIDNFAAVGLFDNRAIVAALLAEMDRMADAFTCRAIRTALPSVLSRRGRDIEHPLLGMFASAGHAVDRLCLQKILAFDRRGPPADEALPVSRKHRPDRSAAAGEKRKF